MPPTTDDLGRPHISDSLKRSIELATAQIEPGKRGTIVLFADAGDKVLKANFAAKFGDHWKVAAGAGWTWGERPDNKTAFAGIADSW